MMTKIIKSSVKQRPKHSLKHSFKQKFKPRKNKNLSEKNDLQLTSQTYFCLLIFQLLNLATLVIQLHWLYLLFATFALALQFIVHLNIARKGALASRLSQSIKSYVTPKILPSWLILLLAISGSMAIAVAGKKLGLLLSMMHLLCFAYSLKMFEIPRRKDLYQLLLLGIFVATSSLIFIQSIYFSLSIIVLVFGNFMMLLNLFAPTMAVLAQAKLVAKLSLYSVPLAVALFVGFPKLSPLWQVPSVESAKVGLSDSVKIGDIAQLALSDELAFRVSFKNSTPKHAQLYWRAMVLDDFDGVTWRQSRRDETQSSYGSATFEHASSSADIKLRGTGLTYQVIAEPSFQSWLFALDFATSEQGNIGRRNDFALFYRGTISQTLSYQVTSYPAAKMSVILSDDSRALNLLLNTDNTPKLLAKGQKLRQQYPDDRQLINQVLTEFNEENYYYTLQPPRLSNNSLDQFYFDTRAGFCEHYASSFTYLMRAAGIPARMVVGYLGGEFNRSGNYLSVYQRSAHAWSEVWLPNSGWQRIDPTAAVDPERVERGFSTSLMQEYGDLSSGLFPLQALRAMWWYKQLKMQVDAIDYQWTRWVIGYTGQKQSRVMAQLLASLKQGNNVLYFLLILTGVALLFYGYKVAKDKAKGKAEDKIKALYLKTLRLMAQHQLVKARSMTAQQFADAIATARPELSANFCAISNGFAQLSYQNFADDISQQERDKQLIKLQLSYRQLRWQLWLAKLGIG
jgi:transglutaminase-like putative cysteine protease